MREGRRARVASVILSKSNGPKYRRRQRRHEDPSSNPGPGCRHPTAIRRKLRAVAATAAFRQAAFVFCLALARLAAAQTDATLVGQAQDRTGASLAGVTVVITHIDTGAVRTLVTD